MDKFREKLSTYDDFSKSFKKYNKRVISELETALEKHVPKLMKQLPSTFDYNLMPFADLTKDEVQSAAARSALRCKSVATHPSGVSDACNADSDLLEA